MKRARSVDPVRPDPGPVAPKKKMLGSWGQSTKMAQEYSRDDFDLMLEALEATGQNFCIYDVNLQDEWDDFERLVAAIDAKGSSLKVFAAMNSITADETGNCWFGTDGPPAEPDRAPYDEAAWDADRLYIGKWIEAWKACATALSGLAAKYKDKDIIAGFVINDFTQIESADQPQCMFGEMLSRDEVKSIADECVGFGLWPCFGTTALGRFVCPGHILGVNYGLTMATGEYAAVHLDFELTVDAADEVTVSFFHCRSIHASRLNPKISLLLDDDEFWSASYLDTDTVQYESVAIGALKAGSYTLTFQFLADPGDDALGDEHFWRIWGVEMPVLIGTLPGGPLPDFPIHIFPKLTAKYETSPSYSADPPDDSYYGAAGTGRGYTQGTCDLSDPGDTCVSNQEARGFDCASLPDSEADGRSLGRIVAAPNDPYLIHDLIAGVVPYTGHTAGKGDTDALGVAYEGLFQRVKNDIGPDAVLMILHWAMYMYESDVDLGMTCEWLTKAAAIADYTAVWNYPLGVYGLTTQEGIFAPWVGTKGDSFTYRARYNGRQYGLSGWTKKWTSTPYLPPVDRGASIGVSVRFDGSSANYLVKVGGRLAMKDDSFTIPLKMGDVVELSMTLIGGANITCTDADFTLSGTPLSFLFTAYVNDWVQTVYDDIRATFIAINS